MVFYLQKRVFKRDCYFYIKSYFFIFFNLDIYYNDGEIVNETISDLSTAVFFVWIAVSIAAGIYAKYFVIKRFELALNSNEMMFKQMSGENTWAIWACVAIKIIYFIIFVMTL